MKNILIWILLISIPLGLAAQQKCGTDEYMDLLKKNNPKKYQKIQEFDRKVNDLIRSKKASEAINLQAAIKIPVVFHVVHNGDALGDNENIDDEYIYSQLTQLNDDFRRTNSDTANTRDIFKDVAADVPVEFCLARVGPGATYTSGIVRHEYNKAEWDQEEIIDEVIKRNTWDNRRYMNVWICNLEVGLLGFASRFYLGGSVVIDASTVGSIDNPNPIDPGSLTGFGRTLTHEVGHWLGLHHIWGPTGESCKEDDGIRDTPPQGKATELTFSCPSKNDTCDHGDDDLPDMIENYMDYSADQCMNMFTKGQMIKMWGSLFQGNVFGYKFGLQDCSCPDRWVLDQNIPYNADESYAALNYIRASNTIDNKANVVYQAEKFVDLLPGFRVKAGASFTAKIEDCEYGDSRNEINPVWNPNITASKIPSGNSVQAVENNDLTLYPNPFSSQTTIKFKLAHESSIQLNVQDLSGRIVKTLIPDHVYSSGVHQVDFQGKELPPGMYLCRLILDDQIMSRKMIISR